MKSMMSVEEYEANKAGLNIFFGAILGVVMADVEALSALQYALLLTMAGGFVVTLLYISASRRRIGYAVYAAAILGLGWWLALSGNPVLGVETEWLANRILPAFSVWLFMIVAVEFAPRDRPKTSDGAADVGRRLR